MRGRGLSQSIRIHEYTFDAYLKTNPATLYVPIPIWKVARVGGGCYCVDRY
jgi:hypothetical protein